MYVEITYFALYLNNINNILTWKFNSEYTNNIIDENIGENIDEAMNMLKLNLINVDTQKENTFHLQSVEF